MANPGVVLKRPAGSDGPFGENAELPKNLGDGGRSKKAAPKSLRRKGKQTSVRAEEGTDRKAAQAYERERQRREREKAREEAARQKHRERRQQAVARAQAALDKAEREHVKRAGDIRTEEDALEKKSQVEEIRWEQEKGRLDKALRQARD
jgi:hypothetical protein